MFGIFYLVLIVLLIFLLAAFFAFTPAKKLVRLTQFAGPAITIALGAILTIAGRGIVGLPMLGIGLAWLQYTRSRLK
ncbi:MAG: hypothetical protein COC00_008120 [Rhizobiales bacterium]|nr:hypothetical protein [Hyphomicrobiales bacterium]